MRIWKLSLACIFLAICILVSGCTDINGKSPDTATFTITEEGVLVPGDISYSYSLSNVTNAGDIILSEIWMKDGLKDVYALLASPKDARLGIVFAPGAGVAADSHKDRVLEYADCGIAFMTVDIRGNGGKTSGVPLDFQNEFKTASAGKTPQYYSIIFDLIAAKDYLKEIYGDDFPVYIMGSSNGGRYAAVAAGIDSEFAGYFGVSTSGYEYEEGKNGENADLFFRSINPYTYIAGISPAKTVIFHAPDDDIVEFDYGLLLFNKASEPKDFVAFNGTHGINSEVDEYIKNLDWQKTKA
ncbi:MAG: hypothetical protein JXQ82_02310 [Methanomicrobiaceae archaeon]|nr:hypothetical protein [Methanomicrobiaceae archaeon]